MLAAGLAMAASSVQCDPLIASATLHAAFQGRGAAHLTLEMENAPAHPDDLAAALGAVFRRSFTNVRAGAQDRDGYGGWRLEADYPWALDAAGLQVAGAFDIRPLIRAVEREGAALWVSFDVPPAARVRCVGAFPTGDQPGAGAAPIPGLDSVRAYEADPGAAARAPIQVAYGFTPADLAWRAGLLGLWGLVVLAVVMRWSRVSLAAGAPDPAAAWLGAAMALRRIRSLALLSAIAGIPLLGLDFALRIACDARTSAGAMACAGAVLLPPVIWMGWMRALARPVFVQLGGIHWTRAQLVQQEVFGLLTIGFPAWCIAMMTAQDGADHWRAEVVWYGAALGSLLVFRLLTLRAINMRVDALTSGDLRDRAFELAERAGVRMQQLYLVRAAEVGMANAYAAGRGIVMVTDTLVARLARREVDAILAHEIAHLRRGHVRSIGIVRAVPIVIGIGAAAMSAAVEAMPVRAALSAVLVGTCLLSAAVAALHSRRVEAVADRDAVGLGIDPEALISGLARLAALNRMPVQWDRRSERAATHYSTRRRAEEIARAGGLAPDRLETALSAPAPLADHYPTPTAGPDLTVFGTKERATWTMWRLLLSAGALPAAMAAWLRFGPDASQAAGLALCAVGSAATAAAAQRIARVRLRSARERAVRSVHGAHAAERFAALAPGEVPRVHEGSEAWDVGLLAIEGGVLRFRGDRCTVSLPRHVVEGVHDARGGPGWFREMRLVVRCRTGDAALPASFLLWSPQARWIGGANAETRRLAADLRRWLAAPGPETGATEPAAPPDPGSVTAMGFRDRLVARVVLQFALAYLVAMWCAAALDPPGACGIPALLVVPAVGIVGALLYLLPTLWWRPARAARSGAAGERTC